MARSGRCLLKVIQHSQLALIPKQAPQALSEGLHGVERVSRIATAMKDSDGQRAVCGVNELLETALAVSRGEWKRSASVE